MQRTPVPLSSAATDSLKVTTHAFAALYVPRGTNAATDATLITDPLPRNTIPGRAACVSRITARTCTSIIRSSSSGVLSRNERAKPKPALLTRMSIGRSPSPSRASTAARPSTVARSALSVSTRTAGAASPSTEPRNSPAAASSRSWSRATSTRS